MLIKDPLTSFHESIPLIISATVDNADITGTTQQLTRRKMRPKHSPLATTGARTHSFERLKPGNFEIETRCCFGAPPYSFPLPIIVGFFWALSDPIQHGLVFFWWGVGWFGCWWFSLSYNLGISMLTEKGVRAFLMRDVIDVLQTN